MALQPKKPGIIEAAPEIENEAEDSTEDGEEVEGLGPVAPTEGYTPDEQHWHDQLLLNAHKLMYSKTGFATMLKKMADGKDDIGASIGHTLAMLLLSIQKSAQAKQAKIPDDVVLDVGLELLGDFMQIATASGMVKEKFVKEATARATFTAFKAYGEANLGGGQYSADDITNAQQALKDFGLDPQQVADATGASEAAKQHAAAAQQPGTPLGPGAAPPAPPAPPQPGAGLVNEMMGA